MRVELIESFGNWVLVRDLETDKLWIGIDCALGSLAGTLVDHRDTPMGQGVSQARPDIDETPSDQNPCKQGMPEEGLEPPTRGL